MVGRQAPVHEIAAHVMVLPAERVVDPRGCGHCASGGRARACSPVDEVPDDLNRLARAPTGHLGPNAFPRRPRSTPRPPPRRRRARARADLHERPPPRARAAPRRRSRGRRSARSGAGRTDRRRPWMPAARTASSRAAPARAGTPRASRDRAAARSRPRSPRARAPPARRASCGTSNRRGRRSSTSAGSSAPAVERRPPADRRPLAHRVPVAVERDARLLASTNASYVRSSRRARETAIQPAVSDAGVP